MLFNQGLFLWISMTFSSGLDLIVTLIDVTDIK